LAQPLVRGDRGPSVPGLLSGKVRRGVLGGYTTFSAFSLDVVLFYERGQLGLALTYALASGGLSIAGLFLGLFVVRAWS
jgi:fluoride ion exporter CrcB/FEX